MTTITYAEILEVEKKKIEARRDVSKPNNQASETVGLALSGGGIRAACFSLGVIGALVERDVWKDVDYVSSVSGGGYTAAATLAAACKAGSSLKTEHVESVLDGVKKRGGFLDEPALAIVSLLVRSAVSSFIVLSWFFILLLQVGLLIKTEDEVPGLEVAGWSFALACILFLLGYLNDRALLGTRSGVTQTRFYLGGKIAAGLSVLFLGVTGVMSLQASALTRYIVICALIGALFVTGRVLGKDPRKPQTRRGQRIFKIVGLPLVFGFFVMCSTFIGKELLDADTGLFFCLYIGAVALLLCGFLVSPNLLAGGFRFYLASLRKTFGGESKHDSLAMLGADATVVPIHIFNCFAQFARTVDKQKKTADARHGGTNFAASPYFCGSRATTFFKASEWAGSAAGNLWALVTLSAAAVDAHPVRMSPLKSAFLRVSNAGLGQWVHNPASLKSSWLPYPTFVDSIRSIFELTSPTDQWLRLSDGGHFENLGLYELVARRCTHIVVVDAGFDPSFEYFDLAVAAQRCYEDFGADIHLAVERGNSLAMCAPYLRGEVRYEDGTQSELLYIKLSAGQSHSLRLRLRGAQDTGFPHEPTTTQYVDDDFVQAYYDLGRESGLAAFENGQRLIAAFE